jgi:hypothetical protein
VARHTEGCTHNGPAVRAPVPGPYDYFTTIDKYDGVPYAVVPTRAYDRETLDDMIFLGQYGIAGVPLGYSGPVIKTPQGWENI